MSTEFDYDLTPQQWETLKALRRTAIEHVRLHRPALDQLVALQLAGIDGDAPFITAAGRKVLVRGSARLLDLAA
jgi:hypothetical protein